MLCDFFSIAYDFLSLAPLKNRKNGSIKHVFFPSYISLQTYCANTQVADSACTATGKTQCNCSLIERRNLREKNSIRLHSILFSFRRCCDSAALTDSITIEIPVERTKRRRARDWNKMNAKLRQRQGNENESKSEENFKSLFFIFFFLLVCLAPGAHCPLLSHHCACYSGIVLRTTCDAIWRSLFGRRER